MEARVPAGLNERPWTGAEGRRFGLTVGGAFLVLAAVTAWRGSAMVAPVFGVVGSLLVACGLLVPFQLEPVYRAWMGLAHAMSKVTTPIFMGVVYLGVITPIALLMRMLGRNPVVHTADEGIGYWKARGAEARARTDLERQF